MGNRGDQRLSKELAQAGRRTRRQVGQEDGHSEWMEVRDLKFCSFDLSRLKVKPSAESKADGFGV